MNLNQEIDKLTAAHAEKIEQLQREYSIRAQLPADAEPKQVYTGSKLYGSVASVKYGSDYQASYSSEPNPAERRRPLAEALALLRSIGEIVPAFIVKDGCTARKPDHVIKDSERERAKISGPFEASIEHAHGYGGATLEAFVKIADGRQISVEIVLDQSHQYGGWRRIDGNEHYPESWRFDVVRADLGQAEFLRFASGSNSGPHSGSRHVYVFKSLSDLDALVLKQAQPRKAGA